MHYSTYQFMEHVVKQTPTAIVSTARRRINEINMPTLKAIIKDHAISVGACYDEISNDLEDLFRTNPIAPLDKIIKFYSQEYQ